jgi:hypothetical protein
LIEPGFFDSAHSRGFVRPAPLLLDFAIIPIRFILYVPHSILPFLDGRIWSLAARAGLSVTTFK